MLLVYGCFVFEKKNDFEWCLVFCLGFKRLDVGDCVVLWLVVLDYVYGNVGWVEDYEVLVVLGFVVDCYFDWYF